MKPSFSAHVLEISMDSGGKISRLLWDFGRISRFQWDFDGISEISEGSVRDFA